MAKSVSQTCENEEGLRSQANTEKKVPISFIAAAGRSAKVLRWLFNLTARRFFGVTTLSLLGISKQSVERRMGGVFRRQGPGHAPTPFAMLRPRSLPINHHSTVLPSVQESASSAL